MRRRVKNILTALLLLALAAALILWKLNIFNLPVTIAGVGTWGLIISVVMVVIIFHSILDVFYPGIFFPLAVLAIIFDDALGITALTPWIVLIVALLLTIAFEKLLPSHWFKKHVFKETVKSKNGDFEKRVDIKLDGNSYSEVGDEESEYVMHSVKMGEGTKYVVSKNLKKAELEVNFGELSVFFDKAEVPTGQVNINAKVAFGEMQLYIPKSWKVINKVSVSMGDCTDRSGGEPTEEDAVVCVIEGSVAFGDLVITKV